MKVIQVGIGGMGNAWLRAVLDSPVVEYAGFVEVSDKIAAEQVENMASTASASTSRWAKRSGLLTLTG